jgi:hypothetical protein
MAEAATAQFAPELIWRGRFHLGDAPGVYGDAPYAGLSVEWPITLRRFETDENPGAPAGIRMRLEAEDVRVYAPHRGHRVVVAAYAPDPVPDDPHRFQRTELPLDVRLTGPTVEFEVPLPPDTKLAYLSVRVEVDTTVHPGLCAEFVLTRLSLLSRSHWATLGFQYEELPAAGARQAA